MTPPEVTDGYRTDFGALLAPFHLAAPGTDPPGAVLAPEDDDELPPGVDLGEIEIGQAPQGARTVAARIHRGVALAPHPRRGGERAQREGTTPG